MRLPNPTRRDLEHAASRARRIATHFGFEATIDAEVPTTWHLQGEHARRPVQLEMGSPRMRRWGAQAVIHWLHLTLRENTWLPEGALLRPAARSVWEWRDGLPGETPHLRVRHDELGTLEYVLLPESLHAQELERAQRTLRSLPSHVSWLSAEQRQWSIRTNLDAASPPEEVLTRLLAWRGLQPLS